MLKKILIVALLNSYGEKARGVGINHSAFYKNFMDLGYETDVVWLDEYGVDELQREILNKANDFQPDLILFKLFKDEVKFETLEKLRKKFFIVNWFGDDQFRFKNYSSKYAPYFDACITTDKFKLSDYAKIGQQNIILSEHASFENHDSFDDVTYEYDVSFIGGRHPVRSWFVKELKKRGINVVCFGHGWKNGRIDYDQMNKVFLSTKINLNLSNSVNFDLRFLVANISVRSIASFIINTLFPGRRDSKNASGIKARTFEIPVRGGFMLTEYVPMLGTYFAIDKEILCYKDVDEAAALIKYYLENDTERENIKKLGVIKARGSHTFRHRILNFMPQLTQLTQNKKYKIDTKRN